MRHATCILLCAVGLGGCAATPSPYGNFLSEVPAGTDRTVADDAVRQLATVYPPANTRFDLQQATPDAFGQRLTAALRAKGYAVQESTPPPAAKERPPRAEGDVIPGSAPVVPLRYVLDSAADLVRITLVVGEQSLTRAYLAQDGTIHPAGAWVRKE